MKTRYRKSRRSYSRTRRRKPTLSSKAAAAKIAAIKAAREKAAAARAAAAKAEAEKLAAEKIAAAKAEAEKAEANTAAAEKDAANQNRTAPSTIFEQRNIVSIVRAAMKRLQKNPADRMFYVNAYRLVYYVGIYLMRTPYGKDFQLFLHSATHGLTTDKTAEEVEKIESELERVAVRLIKYLTTKLSVPYLKEFEEAVTIHTAVGYTLAGLKYAQKLEAAEDATEEELIEEEFGEIEESLELDYFSFPQYIHFLTEGLKAIGKEPEQRSTYYVFTASFIEEVEDAIIKSWFGEHYLIQEEDSEGDVSFKIKDVFQPTVPSNPKWAESLDKRLTYLKDRLESTIAPQVNAFYLKEDQETIILKMIVNDVVESLKVGTDLKSYSGDLDKHEEFLTGINLEAINASLEEKASRAKESLEKVNAQLYSVDSMIYRATISLQRQKRAMEAYKAKIEKYLDALGV